MLFLCFNFKPSKTLEVLVRTTTTRSKTRKREILICVMYEKFKDEHGIEHMLIFKFHAYHHLKIHHTLLNNILFLIDTVHLYCAEPRQLH